MIVIGTVKGLSAGEPLGYLDLDVPTLSEGNTLRRIPPMPLDGLWGVPAAGSHVEVQYDPASNKMRWRPMRHMDPPASATASRRVLYGPSGKVEVVLDDATGEVLLGAVADTKGVARTGDAVQVSQATDGPWYTWLAAVGAATGAGAPPATIGGKVTGGSVHVKAVD